MYPSASGRPLAMNSLASVSAAIAPTAPWAKFKTPVAR